MRNLKFIQSLVAGGNFGSVIFHDEFKESDHPRADNGEFGSGSVSAKQKSSAKFEAVLANKSVSDKHNFLAAKADGISIPPAWTDVIYHGKEGKNGIIAQGKDGKGRSQRLEDPAFRDEKIAEKQKRIANNLSPKMPAITEKLREDAIKGNEAAKVLYLITQTGFRIGGKGDGKAAVDAFGASTLTGDHVKVNGNITIFSFPGKKGVAQNHTINDPVIARIFKNAKRGENVFSVNDAKVREEWKKLGGEKVHDIRSYVATQTAKESISSLNFPKSGSVKDLNNLKSEVAKIVARKLGNNPAEALKTYINPDVFRELKWA